MENKPEITRKEERDNERARTTLWSAFASSAILLIIVPLVDRPTHASYWDRLLYALELVVGAAILSGVLYILYGWVNIARDAWEKYSKEKKAFLACVWGVLFVFLYALVI